MIYAFSHMPLQSETQLERVSKHFLFLQNGAATRIYLQLQCMSLVMH